MEQGCPVVEDCYYDVSKNKFISPFYAFNYCHPVFKGLWVGNYQSSLNEDFLKERGIRSIVQLGTHEDFEMYDQFDEAFCYHKIIAIDKESQDLFQFFDDALNFMKNSDRDVLVHCSGGVSRSSTIACLYVMDALRCTPEKALEIMRQKRGCIKPNKGFLEQLKRWHRARIQGIVEMNEFLSLKRAGFESRCLMKCCLNDQEIASLVNHSDSHVLKCFGYEGGMLETECIEWDSSLEHISPSRVTEAVYQIALGMKALSTRGIHHGRLCLQNVFRVRSDTNAHSVYKIAFADVTPGEPKKDDLKSFGDIVETLVSKTLTRIQMEHTVARLLEEIVKKCKNEDASFEEIDQDFHRWAREECFGHSKIAEAFWMDNFGLTFSNVNLVEVIVQKFQLSEVQWKFVERFFSLSRRGDVESPMECFAKITRLFPGIEKGTRWFDELVALESKKWFYFNCAKSAAQAHLICQSEGEFVVRFSSSCSDMLCFTFFKDNRSLHCRILVDKEGRYCLTGESPRFFQKLRQKEVENALIAFVMIAKRNRWSKDVVRLIVDEVWKTKSSTCWGEKPRLFESLPALVEAMIDGQNFQPAQMSVSLMNYTAYF